MIVKIAKLLGYITRDQAVSEGFDYDGSYYGIPCWIGDPDGDCCVATKWQPLEYLMEPVAYIEGFFNGILGNEPSFMFKLKGEIK